MKKFLKLSYMGFIMIFIYVPITVLIIFSFNSGDSMSIFSGLSNKWYTALAKEQQFLQSIIVSIFTAVITTIVSTVIGTMAAIGLSKARKLTQKMTLSITNIPLINADIITAVTLMMLFLALGSNFGFLTLILAHISFDVPYVIITVLPKLRKIDHKLIEASIDLGAKPSQTLVKVILPILKPAIIAAIAISFAMSFDDFIISYFTGGDDINVATFIYTMKRLKPIVNAFGTICIAIIGFIVIGWNGWNIYKTSHKKLCNEILKGTYKDKQIMRYETQLTMMYYELNKKNTSEKQKNSMRRKIIKLEDHYTKGRQWIIDKKATFISKEERRENHSEILRNKYRWLSQSWKPTSLAFICLVSLGLLTGLYIKNNTYDLIVANWSEYINDNIIRDFENKYNVKVKYVVYDSNETLYNKLYTTSYDVMVPSDYMVNKLATENYLELIDYNMLNQNKDQFKIIKPNSSFNGDESELKAKNKWFNKKNVDVDWYKKNDLDFFEKCIKPINPQPSCISVKKTASLNNSLLKIMNENKVKNDDNITNNNTIANYSIPLYWGNMSLVIKPTSENISFICNILDEKNKILPSFLNKYKIHEENWTNKRKQYIIDDVVAKDTYTNGISWDILWKAAQAGKKVVLNNDYKNLFMIANEIINQKPLPTDINQVNSAFKKLKTLIKFPNVALMNDEIINTVKDGRFDFAFMYNGDAIYADSGGDGRGGFGNSGLPGSKHKLIITNVRNGQYDNIKQKFVKIKGTNIWSDNFVIAKKSYKKKLAYNFINYIISRQKDLTESSGYTSPFQQVINYEIKIPTIKNKAISIYNYAREYVPVSKKVNNEYISSPIASDGPFFTSSLDIYLVNFYNILIAGKH